ncbi:hypothetical protein QBC44DRAFT_336862 [Cladorrhinum sp. PSN332]|nr:hypothetical protein QBC44DRAFT_336862 [Cladorrhinum sp. PSN332]
MQCLKLFAEFLGRTMKGKVRGRLDPEKPKADTGSVRGAMRRFCNAWERENHQEIPPEIKLSMAPFIDGELAKKIGLIKAGGKNAEGKKYKKDSKTFLTIKNYVHMQERHWYDDFYDYLNEGYRVDNTNLLNTHCFTSARLSEVCQAVYEDLQCILSWKDGKPEFRLKFKREVCKATDENQPEHPFAEQIKGPDSLPPPLFAQPMLHWLANAISSRAFADYQDVQQLLDARPPKGGQFRIAEWAEEKKSKPVFPQWTSKGPIDKSREPTSWGYQASNWARRTGFAASFGLHSVRRKALINVYDNGYALGQVLRFASQHNTHVLVNHYLGNVSSIDGAASYLGMELRTDLAEDFLSATMKRNPGLSQTLPASEEEELKRSAEYISLESQIKLINLALL